MADVTVRFDRFTNAKDSLRHDVAVREHWGDAWTTVEHLHCESAEWVASPDTSTAVLYWRYGEGLLPGSTSYAEVAKQDKLRYYVRVQFWDPGDADTKRKWYGVIEVDTDQLLGTSFDGNQVILQGRQSLTAYGLEFLLGQRLLLTTIYNDGTLQGGEIRRAVPFNERGQPNRSQVWVNNSFMFSDDLATASLWNGQDIVEYLLEHHATGNRDNLAANSPPLWELAGAGFGQSPSPELQVHGRSVREVLDAIMSRQRLMSWYVHVEDDTDTTVPLQIVPFNFNAAAINIGNDAGDQIAANEETRKIVLERDPGAQAVLISSTVDAVDQVIVQGRRATSTFTISKDDGTIEAGWSAALQTEYDDAASNAGDYPASTEVYERQRRNAEARTTDRLAAVYARFQIPAAWDFEAGNGTGAGSTEPVWIDDDAPELPLKLWTPGLELRSSLPLLSGFDYSTSLSEPDEIAAGPHTELPPLVITPLPEDTSRYVQVEHVGSAADIEETDDTTLRTWSATVSVPPGELAIWVRVHGVGQHVIAKTDWAPVDASDIEIDKFDWQDFLFTVSIDLDGHCEQRYPTDATINAQRAGGTAPDLIRQMRVDAGDGYRLDYVVAQTVLAIDPEDGSLVRQGAAGGYINDDRDSLKQIARVAHEWLKDAKKAIEFSTTQFTSEDNLHVGDLVTQIGDPDLTVQDHIISGINSVVTRIRVDVPRSIGGGSPGVASWTYSTQFAQFDPLAVVTS